jgi:RNA polymerase sigma-70 factor (ECF subfamily)
VIADESTLRHLMVQSQKGDRKAYVPLLEECGHWLQRYFRRRAPAHQLDDLVQDTLMSLHRKLASYDPARPFTPWLAALARYRWIDHLRRVYRAGEVELGDDVTARDEEGAIVARMSLERLLAQLSPAQAQAIELVKIEGLSVAEAARRCGQSEPLIKVNIHRGLKKLAALVESAQ